MEKNVLLGYFFTVLNYAFYCSSRFCRKKYQMLFWDLLSKISFVTALLCLGAFSGAYSMIITFCYLVCANIKERKNCRWPLLYVFFQALLIFVMVWNFEGISSVFVVLSTSIALLSVWWLRPQKMRIAGITANVMTLCYNISLKNWAGLCELAVIASNLTSFLKYRRESLKKV